MAGTFPSTLHILISFEEPTAPQKNNNVLRNMPTANSPVLRSISVPPQKSNAAINAATLVPQADSQLNSVPVRPSACVAMPLVPRSLVEPNVVVWRNVIVEFVVGRLNGAWVGHARFHLREHLRLVWLEGPWDRFVL